MTLFLSSHHIISHNTTTRIHTHSTHTSDCSWTLTPPGRDIYSNLHPLDFLATGGFWGPAFPYREHQLQAKQQQQQQAGGVSEMRTQPHAVLVIGRDGNGGGESSGDSNSDSSSNSARGGGGGGREFAVFSDGPCELRQEEGELLFVPRYVHRIASHCIALSLALCSPSIVHSCVHSSFSLLTYFTLRSLPFFFILRSLSSSPFPSFTLSFTPSLAHTFFPSFFRSLFFSNLHSLTPLSSITLSSVPLSLFAYFPSLLCHS
jgi:hypothetical protein